MRGYDFWEGHGIPVLTASTIVGATIFGTLQSNPEIGWKIATGIISIGAALLSGLLTLLNFSERAEKHKSAGASYSAIRREFELLKLRFQHSAEEQSNEAITALETLNQQFAKLGQETPSVPDRHWNKANREAQRIELLSSTATARTLSRLLAASFHDRSLGGLHHHYVRI